MNQLVVGITALVTWAISSVILFMFCAFSINANIIAAAIVVILISFIGSLGFFTKQRYAAVYIFAFLPVLVALAILLYAGAVNTYYGR